MSSDVRISKKLDALIMAAQDTIWPHQVTYDVVAMTIRPK